MEYPKFRDKPDIKYDGDIMPLGIRTVTLSTLMLIQIDRNKINE